MVLNETRPCLFVTISAAAFIVQCVQIEVPVAGVEAPVTPSLPRLHVTVPAEIFGVECGMAVEALDTCVCSRHVIVENARAAAEALVSDLQKKMPLYTMDCIFQWVFVFGSP